MDFEPGALGTLAVESSCKPALSDLGLCSLVQDIVEVEVCTPEPLASGYLQKRCPPCLEE